MKKNQKIQIILGLVLFAFLIALILQWNFARTYGTNGQSFMIRFIIGVSFGYILVRSSFGFAGPIKKLVINGDGKQARMMIIMMMLSTTVMGLYFIGQGTNSNSASATGWGSIIGGLLFGFGMMLAGGCASGTLVAVGSGTITSLYVLVFFIIGATAGTVMDKQLSTNITNWNWLSGAESYYGDKFDENGVIWAILINLIIFSLFLALIKGIEIFRNKKGTFYVSTLNTDEEKIAEYEDKYFKFFSIRQYFFIFQKRWNWLTGAILLAGLLGIAKLAGTNPGIIGGIGLTGEWLLYVFGWHNIVNTSEVTGFASSVINPMKNNGIIFIFAVLLGAFFYHLSSWNLKFANYKDWTWREWVLIPSSGLLMGIGAKLAHGCNVGAMWVGISGLSAHGWIFTIFLIFGGIGGTYTIKRMKYLCK